MSFYIKIADSGAKRELTFCSNYGTRIYARPVKRTIRIFWVKSGQLTKKDLEPKRQAWKNLVWIGSGIETDQTFETQPR